MIENAQNLNPVNPDSMLVTTLGMVAIVLYVVAAVLLWMRLKGQTNSAGSLEDMAMKKALQRKQALALGILAIILHAITIQTSIVSDAGYNLSFANVVSLATWFITGLLLLSATQKPLENLGIVVLPIAAASVVIQNLLPGEHVLTTNHSKELGIHILFSILAYSLLGLAAVQALLLSKQERSLHARIPGGIIRSLPPLETMESLLFQMLITGFLLQSISLITGFFYLEDMFAQHMVHKTVLSLAAWVLFAALLLGHWRYGWRGRTAVRWTLSGFITLLLAYFGSKYVLEILLSR